VIRGRFAPSPTGPLHLGNARTALLSWLAARARGGRYAMRVEDLDGPRVRPGLEAAILAELRWLGLDWDEGPDVGGPAGPYRQSERLGRYAEALARLRDAAAIYPCFCSRAEIAAASRAPHGPSDEGPRYPGTCRALAPEEVAARSRTRAPAWRFRVPPGPVAFQDGVHGPQAFHVGETVGDSRQLLLYGALSLEPPRFAHVPLVVGEDGERLAKRHGALSLGELRARGATPEAVVGLLAELSGLSPAGARARPRELVAGFTLGAIRRAPAVLRAARLEALLR
jgi:glutamyl-tRNA synthetase